MPLIVLDESTKAIIAASKIFDGEWYGARYADAGKSALPPIEHYFAYGISLRRSPSLEFDPVYYQARNPDLSGMDGLGLLLHYLETGRRLSKPGADLAAAAAESSMHVRRWFLTGFLDKATGEVIAGWAMDRRRPNESVELELWIDGTWVMDFRTSTERADVVAREGGGGRAGFNVRVPPATIRDKQSVEVRFKDSGGLLPGTPLQYSSPRGRGGLPLPQFVRSRRSRLVRNVTVIVPVYNAQSAVEGCLESLASVVMPDGASVLVVNDASTDPAIAPLLERFARVPGFKVVENEKNIGYTRTINKAIRLCDGNDVVLLNSDTIVTDRWLHNLQYSAYSQPDIGTATPLSDNAGAFSVPEIGVHNPLPPHLDRRGVARCVMQAGNGEPLDVPTGNGFCLFIKRDALDEVGLFDEESFPRGYGEENDLCMRMLHEGWRNVVCDKSYVFHLRTQSFGEQKEVLVSAGTMQLAVMHPEYSSLTHRFSDLYFNLLRSRIRAALSRVGGDGRLRRILFVLSTTTGGTPQTNLDLMQSLQGKFDCYLLRSDSTQLVLSRLRGGELEVVETRLLHFKINQVPHRSEEYDRIVGDLLFRHSIELVHIRHVAWHGLGLASVTKMLGIPVVYSFHDFYALCPSVNLLDTDNVYRGVSVEGDRLNPLWPNQPVPAGFLPRWRKMMAAFLSDCDRFITTSDAAASLAIEAYPEIHGRMQVIPHGRDFVRFDRVATSGSAAHRLKVLAPGNIGPSKGALLIESIARLAGDGIEFHFLGRTDERLKSIGVHHGEYKREEFAAKVSAISPHIGVIFSVCPETYCHTLTEMWASGIPVLALDIGAVGERIRASGAGWLSPFASSPEEIVARLKGIQDDVSDRAEKIRNVHAWQETKGVADSVVSMGFRYREVYARLLDGRGNNPVKVGLLVKGGSGRPHPPTAHIRLLRPLMALERDGGVITRTITADEVIAGAAAGLDVVVIQRDALSPGRVDSVLAELAGGNIPHVYEIDDLLWDIPATHKDHGIDSASIEAMDKVARTAALITTSTDPLSDRLGVRYGRPIRVVPNALDELLWCSPLDEDWVNRVCEPLGLGIDRRRILYMGSDSHARDLEILDPVFQKIRYRFPDVQVLQIGGGHPLSYARSLPRPQSAAAYPGFVAWFRAIASRCSFAVSPLLDDGFSEVKSAIKHLDYMSAGLFGIYSDVPIYRSSVIDGVTGMLCANEHDAWEEAIALQLERPERGASLDVPEWGRLVEAATISGSAQYQEWRAVLGAARHHMGD